MEIKGQKLLAWKAWIVEELTPPVKVDDETKYVLEAFLELINSLSIGT